MRASIVPFEVRIDLGYDPQVFPWRSLIIALLVLLPAASLAGQVGWRNDGTGRFPGTTPPTHWSATKNVKWKTALPSWGNASPIVVGDRVYVTGEPARLFCLEAASGRVLWEHSTEVSDGLAPDEAERIRPLLAEAAKADGELTQQLQEISRLSRELRKKTSGPADRAKLEAAVARANALKLTLEKAARYRTPLTNDTIGSASATPVSDGQFVYAVFGNGVVTSFDAEGHRRWARWLGEPRSGGMNGYASGHAASPLLVGGKLIVPFDQITALDPADGKVLWKSVSYRDSGTPVATRLADEEVLITPDGHVVSVKDGRTISEQLAQVFYDGPIVEAGVAYYSGSAEVAELFEHGHAVARAVRLGAKAQRLWETNLSKDYFIASPLLQNGLLYALSEAGLLSVLDARTGAVVYEQSLGSPKGVVAYPSLSVAGDLLFASTDDGVTRVIRPGRQYALVAENHLEPLRASLFFSGRRLYVRTLDSVYCIEEPTRTPRK